MTHIVVDGRERPGVYPTKNGDQVHIVWDDFFIVIERESIFFKYNKGQGSLGKEAFTALIAALKSKETA